jgi:hypothetical protein
MVLDGPGPACALVLLSLLSLDASAQTPRRDGSAAPSRASRIRGRVLAADSDTPLRNARVTLTGRSTTDTAAIAPVYTDSNGRFEVAGVPDGQCSLLIAKTGYATSYFGARQPFDRPMTITVDHAIVDVGVTRLQKGAAVSGRILDDVGDPVIGGSVVVSRITRVEGRAQLQTIRESQTDDLGEYRVGNLEAATYVVAGGGGGGTATRWALTFYPGVSTLSEARRIILHAGDEQTSLDFAVAPVDARGLGNISGQVFSADAELIDGTLSVGGVDRPTGASATSVRLPRTGEFRVSVEPGDYVVAAFGSPGGIAMTTVTVAANSDVAGLTLVLATPGRLAGRVIFDGVNPPPPAQVELEARPRVPFLVSGHGSRLGLAPVRPRPDGSFEIANLAGSRVLAIRAPRDWSVKSVTWKGEDLLDAPIDFKGGEDVSGVEIVLTNHPTELAGTVEDETGQPLVDYSLLVFPVDAALRRASRMQWVRPDQTGRFRVRGLPPGAYFAVVTDEVDDSAWRDDQYLAQFASRAMTVTLTGGSQTVTLRRVMPR